MTREEQFLIWILFSRFTNYFNDFTSARQCRWVEYSGQSSSDESFQEHFCLLTCFNPRLITQLLSSRHKWRRNGLFRCCQRLCHKKVFADNYSWLQGFSSSDFKRCDIFRAISNWILKYPSKSSKIDVIFENKTINKLKLVLHCKNDSDKFFVCFYCQYDWLYLTYLV